MRRALLVVSLASLFAVGCSDDERPKGISPVTDTGSDSTLPIFESGVDSAVNPMDDGLEDGQVVDSGTPTDAAMDTTAGDVVEIDVMMTRDTAIDAIKLEAGEPDTRPDTGLPDVYTVSDTRIDSDPDAPMPPPS